MLEYIIKRLLLIPVTLIGIFTITFALLYIVPGDPVATIMGEKGDAKTKAAIRAQLNLDKPLYEQYGLYLGNVVKGDLGQSFITRKKVTDSIVEAFPLTFNLALLSVIIMTVIGIPVGIISSIKQRSLLDRVLMVAAIGGVSAPGFWVGLIALLLFVHIFHIFPLNTIEVTSLGWPGYLGYLILPASVLGVRGIAIVARLTRSTLLEVIRQDYIRTARAKGLTEKVVIFKHALRNALIPVITYVGMDLAFLMGGAVVTETVFAWPGLGRLAVQALRQKDIPVVLGTVLFTSALIVVANLLTDLSYAAVDPRVKLGNK
ncbi:peptide ABC transporter permease [bacterium (Candidatus Blackallbacteria) CG17_big_fil_post_rev_8_21_14_2_50_48_46]|uniref:Peptide ABC transporter permease n=1 Tax=bacterium (Candidatus Blackallbacteria) CG17_big_fil_post_rev_8_21_14_2_50_48_46 TaxID=2014261 RepID=A0A2M7G8J3_9BACT|nr:MAG: peptide ABC transporter permease [bacterium (Candidatus Blackallbacteria) CG18_big_fil_WC_8_21_14_2_50_49_26]PIW18116.1 MAG: peptide ABC transporter permease [bacterium (Candidatus Blackallbacteria) CG17_big_fil_post_rev_8_21_14_2_50_48_46]PIW51125.1 MAG: peptide ABC transporter permease [bacterium (Candidatus Blackallbacteria) CG13_big_fil_rev_8_21_14_2_50_49_14]